MLNVQYVMSQSFPNAGVTQLPTAPNLQATNSSMGGTDQFSVGQYDAYSFHIFITGSNVNGTLYQGVSNNCSTFIPYQTANVAGTNANQDVFFAVPTNISQFTKLYWSGSGAGQVTASVALYGNGGGWR